MIFVDTNVFYSVFFETEMSEKARDVINSDLELVTSAIVINELVYTTARKLAEVKFGIRGYAEFRKLISDKGYAELFDLKIISEFMEDRGIAVLNDASNVEEWFKILEDYSLLPNDALIAATCKHYGIKKIATFDDDFRRVHFLEVIKI